MNITDIVRDNTVTFLRYRKSHLYYAVYVAHDDQHYMFPVPLDDVGDATFEAEDNAIMFMRYIKKAIEEETFVKAN